MKYLQLIVFFTVLFSTIGISQQLPVVGYYTKEDSIIFELRISDHRYVVEENTEKVIPLSTITIFNVALAGEFNSWNTKASVMHKIDNETYHTSLPLDSFGMVDTEFAFVINGSYWVEPSQRGINRVSAPCWLGYLGTVYTTLLYPQTHQRLMTNIPLTDQNARKWLMNHAIPVHTHSLRGLDSLKQFVQSKRAIGIGHNSLLTFETRFRIAQYLLPNTDYSVMAFQVDSSRAEQIYQYVNKGSAILNNDYDLEIVQVLDWSYEHPEIVLMAYQHEDVAQSLNALEQIAAHHHDKNWKQEVDTLVKNVRSLLNLQEIWGLYYYDSPSYQEYLLLTLCSVQDNLPDLLQAQREAAEKALTVINHYITSLSHLKGYYHTITQEISHYFDWMDSSSTYLQLIAWVPNQEMGRNTPGSLGQYLDDRYKDQYLAIAVGSFHFQDDPLPPFFEKRFPTAGREAGSSAYLIDLRKESLTSEEIEWLAQKIYPHSPEFHRQLSDDFDIVLLVNESNNHFLKR
ncbi:hypothetical protein [Catalinimonas niigatensis]|uniref:hypothetical protein n=1 Tax=Catalinimonas niigatensis TaxID=1397264 RepID=UPI00266666FF|nr:hypothetical protein [Catalinimonas niigatensis]WPP49794.1 hypothetical protein PZB72_24285 [Catalinimonas niigatensis]